MVLRIENPHVGGHIFDTGTSEGLMMAMHDNNGTILSSKDEFASFNISFDKTSSSNMEKSRFLSLYSCTPWSRTTKTNGVMSIQDPRFNLISFTQPLYMATFAKNSTSDGFFQRFLTSVPKEMFIKRREKKAMLTENEDKNKLDMENVLRNMYKDGRKNKINLILSSDAEEYYDAHHDGVVVDYRQEDLYEEGNVSIKSKSVGLAMRLSGVICLLRNYSEAVLRESEKSSYEEKADYDEEGNVDEEYEDNIIIRQRSSITENSEQGEETSGELNYEVTGDDFKMALGITNCSVQTSIALISGEKPYPCVCSNSKSGNKKKAPKGPNTCTRKRNHGICRMSFQKCVQISKSTSSLDEGGGA